jgi:hypothetical protein
MARKNNGIRKTDALMRLAHGCDALHDVLPRAITGLLPGACSSRFIQQRPATCDLRHATRDTRLATRDLRRLPVAGRPLRVALSERILPLCPLSWPAFGHASDTCWNPPAGLQNPFHTLMKPSRRATKPFPLLVETLPQGYEALSPIRGNPPAGLRSTFP